MTYDKLQDLLRDTPLDSDSQIDPDDIIQVDIEKLPADLAPPFADAAPPPWTNLNPIINRLADAQNVEPGSGPWMGAGPAPFSGSAGSQASYGWRHDHKIDDRYIRAVIANYGHRPSYYLGAPFRSFPYGSAGRPKGWSPVEWNDLPSGEKFYLRSNGDVVNVSGPDAEHFWCTPLYAVFDSAPISVFIGPSSKEFPSTTVAALLIKLQAASVVGMIRDSSGGTSQQPYPWAYGDRANSRILSTIVEAIKRNCLPPSDAATATLWIRDVLLPWYERTPGISFFNLQPIPANHWSIGCFNGLYWCLPVFYDAMKCFAASPVTDFLAVRFKAIVDRWSQWALDLEEFVPNKGFSMAQVFLPRKEFKTGGPLDTIKPLLLDPAVQIRFDAYSATWETWSYRAASVAAKMTGSPVLQMAADGILARRNQPSNQPWLVDADGEWAT